MAPGASLPVTVWLWDGGAGAVEKHITKACCEMRVHLGALLPPVGLLTGLCDVRGDVKWGSAAPSSLHVPLSLFLCPSEKLH